MSAAAQPLAPTETPDDPWLIPTQAAEYLQLAEKTLANWRAAKTGPTPAIRGRIVRYKRSELDRWMTEGDAPTNVTPIGGRR